MNFMVVALGQIAVALPAAPFGREKKALTLFWYGATHCGSQLACILVGSFINAYVMSRMKIASHGKNFQRVPSFLLYLVKVLIR